MSYEVTIEVDGEETVVDVAPKEYVLDASEDAGLDLPYSCRAGQCTSCAARMEAGAVDRDGVALDHSQREDGYVLICSATPEDDCHFVAGEEIQEELLGIDFDAL